MDHLNNPDPSSPPPLAGFNFVHRGAYASGTVFTSSMLDSLLPRMYNSQQYDLLGVVRKLLGLDILHAAEASQCASGILAHVEVTHEFLQQMPGEQDYDSAALFLLKVRRLGNMVPT